MFIYGYVCNMLFSRSNSCLNQPLFYIDVICVSKCLLYLYTLAIFTAWCFHVNVMMDLERHTLYLIHAVPHGCGVGLPLPGTSVAPITCLSDVDARRSSAVLLSIWRRRRVYADWSICTGNGPCESERFAQFWGAFI